MHKRHIYQNDKLLKILGEVKVAQSCKTLCDLMAYTVHGILQARILEWVAFPFPRDLPNPGIKPRSPTWQMDSLSAEPQGKPKNTGVGNLSLLEWIFLTQKSNQGLLHCRQILHQLSHQGRPMLGELYRSLSRVASLHNTGKLMFRDGGNYMIEYYFVKATWYHCAGNLQSWEIGDRERRSMVIIFLFREVEIEQKVGMWGDDKAVLMINLV